MSIFENNFRNTLGMMDPKTHQWRVGWLIILLMEEPFPLFDKNKCF
jgi:hypothetical protein